MGVAARAGTSTPWYAGSRPGELRTPAAGNIADLARREALGALGGACDDQLDDRHVMHAPVGSFPPNAHGLHDMIGNVWEWCADEYASYRNPAAVGTGKRSVPPDPKLAIYRGGSFGETQVEARSANRAGAPPDMRHFTFGVRPARRVR